MLAPNDHDAIAAKLLDRMFDIEFRVMQSPDDTALLAEVFHPDVVIHEPAALPYAGDWRGRDGIAALILAMGDTWSAMAVEDRQATCSGDSVYMSCQLSLTARASGKSLIQPFAELLRFKDGLVIEGTPFYFDTYALAAAIGIRR